VSWGYHIKKFLPVLQTTLNSKIKEQTKVGNKRFGIESGDTKNKIKIT